MSMEPEGRQAKRKDQVVILQAIQKDSVLKTMSSKEGRLFIGRILERTGYMTPSFTGSSETFFREGRRSIGLQIYNELMAVCPDLYWQMVQELSTKEASNG